MPEIFPSWAMTLLPDDAAYCQALQHLCRQWMVHGLALHPTPEGGLTYYPKEGLSPLQQDLVRAMVPYKPVLLQIVQAHPALALFREEAGPPVVVCPSCLMLVPMIDGQAKAHQNQFNNKPCVGTGTWPRRRRPPSQQGVIQ